MDYFLFSSSIRWWWSNYEKWETGNANEVSYFCTIACYKVWLGIGKACIIPYDGTYFHLTYTTIRSDDIKYGKLSSKEAIVAPWWTLYIDYMGPCTLKGYDASSHDFMWAMLTIPATGLFELEQIPTWESSCKGNKVTGEWSSAVIS